MKKLAFALLISSSAALAQPGGTGPQLGQYRDNAGYAHGIVGTTDINPDGTAISGPIFHSGGSLTTGQVSIGTVSTLLVPGRSNRIRVQVSVGAANGCAFGNSGVTLTTGYLLQPVAGASTMFQTGVAIYAVCSATTVISYAEDY